MDPILPILSYYGLLGLYFGHFGSRGNFAHAVPQGSNKSAELFGVLLKRFEGDIRQI